MKINSWCTFSKKINFINIIEISTLLNSFFTEIVNKHNSNHIMMQLRFSSGDNYKSIGKVHVINHNSLDKLINIYKDDIIYRYSKYIDDEIDSLFICYKILDSKDPLSIKGEQIISAIPRNLINKDHTKNRLITADDLNLPRTMDISKWSDKFTIDTPSFKMFSKEGNIYRIDIVNQGLKNIIRIFHEDTGNFIVEIVDQRKDENNFNVFERTIGDRTTIFDGRKTNSTSKQELKPLFIKKIKNNPKIQEAIDNIVTMDLETRTKENGDLEVISGAIYNPGLENKTFHISDYEFKPELMIIALFDYIFNYKEYFFNNKKIYLHNLSGFDGIFIMKHLANYADLMEPYIKDSKHIEWAVHKGDCTIFFRDSLLILPASLASLGKSFGHLKTEFDFGTLKDNQSLLDCKDKLLEYNLNDCIVLYNILKSFNEEIFNLFSLNIWNYPSIPSLAFAIYRSKFMKMENIPITESSLYQDIYSCYLGGHVDVYKPSPNPGEQVYCYDINSLYPYVMQENYYPVGKPTYFEGWFEGWHKKLGIYYVDVICPNLEVPFLMTRVDGKTIAPVGNFSAWLTSADIQFAMKLGYKFKMHKGYTFKAGKIFSNYVETIYDLRLEAKANEDKAKDVVCKLLLNSLYGRFGMSPFLTKYHIVEPGNYNGLLPEDIIQLGANELVSFPQAMNRDSITLNISLPVSAFVTSYARREIYFYKQLAGKDLLYSDTDSIFTTKPIPNKYIGNKLGQMKLEYVAQDAVFLAPKVYGVSIDGVTKIKVKGAKNLNFSLEELKKLLIKDESLVLDNEKWYRDITRGTINIKKLIYTLKVSENKRNLVYKDGVLVGTSPIRLPLIESKT